jgi:NADH:ubiquinone oxidoreductase subunit F (NADH-binding)
LLSFHRGRRFQKFIDRRPCGQCLPRRTLTARTRHGALRLFLEKLALRAKPEGQI